MKQTRFNLECDKQVSAGGPLSTFGRNSQHTTIDNQEPLGIQSEAAQQNNTSGNLPHPSSLKKPQQQHK